MSELGLAAGHHFETSILETVETLCKQGRVMIPYDVNRQDWRQCHGQTRESLTHGHMSNGRGQNMAERMRASFVLRFKFITRSVIIVLPL